MRRTIRKQLPAVFPEPVALLAEVGAHALDERPESARVVEVDEMAQLVHDDVVEDPPRCEHEPPRERQRAFRRARPETRTRVANGDAATPNPDARSLYVD